MAEADDKNDLWVFSDDPEYPANLICELCRKFYRLGWVSAFFTVVRKRVWKADLALRLQVPEGEQASD